MYQLLTTKEAAHRFSLVGYQIDKTLSEHGSVSRGVCEVDDQGNLKEIHERTTVYFKDGKVFYEENGEEKPLPSDNRVSMNFWGFTPAIFDLSVQQFREFAVANAENPKSEFFIPLVADRLINDGTATFKVIPTQNKWFGVTYKEDKPIVQQSIDELVQSGVYPENLWK